MAKTRCRAAQIVVGLILALLLCAGCGRKPLQYETIWESAQNGVISDIDQHLANGVAVNARGGDMDGTPLMAAAEAGQLEMVKYLLKKGAGVNAEDLDHQTAALYAARNGHDDIVKLLLDNGADINARGGDDATLLSIYAAEDDTEMVELLVSSGAKVPVGSDDPYEDVQQSHELASYSDDTTAALEDALREQDPETYARMVEKRKQSDCMSNLKQISLAMLMYAQDYDEHMPMPRDVAACLNPYMMNTRLWRCPSWEAGDYGYAMVREATNRRLATFVSPAEHFSLFESGIGREPLVGGPGDLADPARHNGGNNFAFMDGHVKWISAGNEPPAGWEQ